MAPLGRDPPALLAALPLTDPPLLRGRGSSEALSAWGAAGERPTLLPGRCPALGVSGRSAPQGRAGREQRSALTAEGSLGRNLTPQAKIVRLRAEILPLRPKLSS